MSPSSASPTAALPAAEPRETGRLTRPSATLVPEWHGRYQARRGHTHSDPKVRRFLIAMAISAILGSAILLSYFLLQDLKQTDQLRAEAASLEIAAATRDVLNETEEMIRGVAPALAAYSTDPDTMDAAMQRQIRREVFAAMDDSPVAGLVMVNGLGEVLFETGYAERVSVANWAKLPLEPFAETLDQTIAFSRPEAGDGLQTLFILPGEERAIAALIDSTVLTDALTPQPGRVGAAYLYDSAGRVLATSASADPDTRLMVLNDKATLLDRGDDAAVMLNAGRTSRTETRAATEAIGVSDLSVMATAQPVSLARFITASAHLLAAGIGLALFTVGLFVYVVQTEWKKRDRRESLDEDVVARSEIAADIMGAGIIDWRVADAVVSYSEGWHRLFSDDDLTTGEEEIFDWIDKLHPDCKEAARNHYQDLVEGRVFEIDHEISVRHRDGNYITVRERGRARINAAGLASRIVLVQRNIRV